ncbi:peptidylprolyl isomerase [Candidatus Schneideria nysicola]|uniref:peptidylprolyl isomerase n=1 Tax=Candidatus Schneideria nysicola TaxID=1081631 RepID=UPI001CAA5D07|nr:peptidylprolyl isomerase [Candidatus Schneideria nysicola]UAJ65025.1 peptidylprolyl isomerase [Candidatus Schneideria nysicola]
MIKYTILLVSIFTICNGYTQPRIIDGIIARINNNIILKSDIDHYLINDINPIFYYKKKYFYKNIISKELLNQIILDKLISQYIKEKGLKISEKKINDVINNIINHFSNRETFFNYLISKNIDFEIYRDNLRKYLILSDLCNKNIYSRITILSNEVDNIAKQIYFYNTYLNIEFNINYIFIPLNKEILEKEINTLFLLVDFLRKNNNDFNSICSKNIYITSFKIINTGWSKLNKLPSIFYEYLQDIQEGDIIGPILSQSGFYILKINGIRNEKLNKKTEVRFKQIILHSSNSKTEKEIENYLKNIVNQIKNGKMNFSIEIINLFKDLGYFKFNEDRNWYSSKNIDPNIYSVLINLKKGEVSIPIFYNNVWNILQLIDIRQVDDIDSSYIHNAYRLILDYKISQRIRIWTNKQYVSTYIKLF